MTKSVPLPAVFELDAVLEYAPAILEEPLRTLSVCHRDGRLLCRTALPDVAPPTNAVRKARVTFMFGSGPEPSHRQVPIVIQIVDDPHLEIIDLIPDDAGHEEHIVQRFRELASQLGQNPLRRFVSDVFSIPDVYRCFWTCPGSQHNHHATAGGLASHSIEMAEQVLAMSHLASKDREIGTVFALLHDIGKIWMYTSDHGPWTKVGHQILGLQHVMAPLANLQAEWPDAASALALLLSGRWRDRDGKAVLAIAEVVRGLDQLSAERDLRVKQSGRFVPWQPAGWLPAGKAEARPSGKAAESIFI